jgi:hypothetical protein
MRTLTSPIYWLGGKDNYRADREAAAEAVKIFPKTVESARSCRAFLSRVVTYLTAEAGIRQFLDLGSGLPSARNVHEVAQSIAPESQVVYVDHDPVVLLHARALLRSRPEGATSYIQPVAVMLLAVLHDAAASGSYLAIGHHTADIDPEVRAFAARLSELNPAFPSTLRSRQPAALLAVISRLAAPIRPVT